MDFEQLCELSARRMGGSVVLSNDEFFAAADNLITHAEPTFQAHTFGHKGQIYDGWETRRRREPGHDYAIVRLGAPGIIRGVVVDTAFFLGNYPAEISIEACGFDGYPGRAELEAGTWTTIVARSAVQGGARNRFEVTAERRYTHVRLSIYPDGGVARLRVFGEVVPDPRLLVNGMCDLAAAEWGAAVEDCSDTFYNPASNLLLPGQPFSMGEGWETSRRRDDGNDWAVIRLAAPGRIALAELDTTHYKGNAPGWATIEGREDGGDWVPLLPRTALQPDTRHRFPLRDSPRVTHIRLSIFPDGGMARLRLPGLIAPDDMAALTERWSRTT